MIRYFKQEDLTKETITEDGWYKTGDIGQWESDGTLSIIDRIKNLVSFPMMCFENVES
jgi:long-chain acyl-CoA synthetase